MRVQHRCELALARLAGVSGLVPSVEWLLYSAIRKEALLTSQIEGTQATLTDLFDEEAGQWRLSTAGGETLVYGQARAERGGAAGLDRVTVLVHDQRGQHH